MDITSLLQALPENKDAHIYLLFEAGAQTQEQFRVFHSEHASSMYPLYIHPQLQEFQEYGPWLLEAKDKTQLSGYSGAIPGTAGIIVAHRHLSSVAVQLSRGCTVVGPDNNTSLVRFYAHHVISTLASASNNGWHTFLFRDIEQWWIPGKDRWEQIVIPASSVLNPADHVIRLDEKRWQLIADKPDVSSVLTQWLKMPSGQHFPPCAQREMVVKALRKAKEAGLTEGADSKLYALYYLDGGKKRLESVEMQDPLQKVSRGEISLAQVLTNRRSDNR